MRFDVITIFPEFFTGPLDHGIVRRAREASLVEVHVHDLRGFAHDRHRTVDDRPFGGGEGMVLKPEPVFEAVESLIGQSSARVPASTAVVLLSASGELFRQETARRFAGLKRIILLCGRYEGVDERVAEHLATQEVSIGDFVLSGGELAAALIVDAVTRLVPGALGNAASAVQESFSEEAAGGDALAAAPVQSGAAGGHPAQPRQDTETTSGGILDCPHYTRPQVFRGWAVPEVLASGNHAEIRRWRRKMALAKTLRHRPDLLAATRLSVEDRKLLAELQDQR